MSARSPLQAVHKKCHMWGRRTTLFFNSQQRDEFKEICVTKAGPWALLLKEIASLRIKAIFVNHNPYCFGKILDTLRLRSKGQSEKNLHSLYIQESHRERFNKQRRFSWKVLIHKFVEALSMRLLDL